MILRSISHTLARVTVTAVIGAVFASAQQQVPPSSISAIEGKRLVQQKIGDCGAAPFHWNGVALSYSQGGLEVKGFNRHGAEWKTIIPATTAGKCEIWVAALPHQPGLLIWNADLLGEYNSELVALNFDQDGNPIPWMVQGKFSSDRRGIAQIITGRNENPAVIVATKRGDRWDGEAVVYQKYDFLTNGVTKVHGAQDGVVWPLSTGATQLLRGTEQKDTESVVSGTSSPLGNIVKVLPEEGDEEQRILFTEGKTLKLPRIIVFDSANGGRQIFFPQDVPEAIDLLKSSGAAVSQSGESCEEDDCHPFILWATAAS